MEDNEVQISENIMNKTPNWTKNKVGNMIGVKIAELGRIHQPSIIHMVNPSEIPTMLVDLEDQVHKTLVDICAVF